MVHKNNVINGLCCHEKMNIVLVVHWKVTEGKNSPRHSTDIWQADIKQTKPSSVYLYAFSTSSLLSMIFLKYF